MLRLHCSELHISAATYFGYSNNHRQAVQKNIKINGKVLTFNCKM
jgi:hypothetical protein